MLSKIHCFVFQQDARVWALVHGSPLDGMGLVLTKADQLTAIEARIRVDLDVGATLEDVLKKYLRLTETHRAQASSKLYAGHVVSRPSSTGAPTVKW